MSKRKHRAEWMLERVREYLAGKGSYKTIAKANGIGSKTSYRVDFSGNLLYDIQGFLYPTEQRETWGRKSYGC